MIIYLILFILSLSGIAVIALRHREQMAGFNLAVFMEDAGKQIVAFWYSHMHSQMFTLLEKQIRWTRIQVLKIENFLFRLTHGVRGISERNGNGNGHSNSSDNSQES